MPLQQLRNVNFGLNRVNATGSTGVGYTIYDTDGAIVTTRSTTGVYQITSGSGIYASYVTFPDNFHGQLLWDTGTAFVTKSYATEQVNVEENNPKVNDNWSMLNSITGSIALTRDITAGRWKIVSNKMQFYKEDNVTLVAEYNLTDDLGAPSMDAVFERTKI